MVKYLQDTNCLFQRPIQEIHLCDHIRSKMSTFQDDLSAKKPVDFKELIELQIDRRAK